ncbi:MAG: hypothetical protein H6918_13215 [Sphingomonadaceae bacterium]|nr:hypothetical protein [Sphingomonadaceae bacterium]
MRIGASFALLAAFLGSAATPQDRIALSRTVYVETIDGAVGYARSSRLHRSDAAIGLS